MYVSFEGHILLVFVHIAQGHSIALGQCMAQGYAVRILQEDGSYGPRSQSPSDISIGLWIYSISPLSPRMKAADMEGQPYPRRWL